MSHRVYAQTEIIATRLPPTGVANPSALLEENVDLDDESALVLSQFDGHLVTAISPTGPNAYFNSLQIPRLIAELRAAAAPAPRVVQRNLNDVADFIEGRTQTAGTARYVSFVV